MVKVSPTFMDCSVTFVAIPATFTFGAGVVGVVGVVGTVGVVGVTVAAFTVTRLFSVYAFPFFGLILILIVAFPGFLPFTTPFYSP